MTGTGLNSSRPNQDRAIALGLFAMAVAMNTPALFADTFLLDDQRFIFDNPLVVDRGAQPPGELVRTSYLGYPVPALVATWAAFHRTVGLDIGLLHAFSVLVHAATVAGLFVLGRRLGVAPIAAATGALLLAVHPVTAEPVAWMTQLGVVAATACVTLALVFFVRMTDPDEAGRTRRDALAAVAAFSLAVAYKPAVVALPLVVPYLVWSRRGDGGAPHERPAAVAFAACAALSLASAASTLGGHTGQDWVVPDATVAERAFTVCAIAAVHLRNAFVPTHLQGWYERPDPTLEVWLLGGGGILVVGALLVWLALGRRTRGTAIGLGALVVLLGYAPHAGFPTAVRRFVAESHLYVATLGAGLLAAGVLDRLRRRHPQRTRAVAIVVAATWLSLGALRLAHQDRHRSAARFWVPVLETYPYHPKATWCLGFSRLLAADGTEIWQRSDLVPAIGWWARAHLHHHPRHDAAFERDPRGLTTPMAQALQRLEEREAAACMRSLDYRATRADLQTCFRLTHQADVRAGLEAELSRE